MEESILEFYYTIKHINIDRVIFELDSKALNTYYNMDRLSKIMNYSRWEFYKSYLLDYYNNRMAFETFFDFVKKNVLNIDSTEVAEDKEEFYNKTIEEDRKATDVYEMNEKDIAGLIEIAEYCKENGIELIFFSPPINARLYEEVPKNFEILKLADMIKKELSYYATVYDMQFISELSYMKDEWRDAWHYNEGVCRIVEKNLVQNRGTDTMRIYRNGKLQ